MSHFTVRRLGIDVYVESDGGSTVWCRVCGDPGVDFYRRAVYIARCLEAQDHLRKDHVDHLTPRPGCLDCDTRRENQGEAQDARSRNSDA